MSSLLINSSAARSSFSAFILRSAKGLLTVVIGSAQAGETKPFWQIRNSKPFW